MKSNCLQLNTNKTELLWRTTARRQHQVPQSSFNIGSNAITASSVVRELEFTLTLTLVCGHTSSRLSLAATLRQLRSIRRSVPSSAFQTLVVALVLTKLDYGNATLTGLRANLLNRLQSVLSASALSIAGLRRSTLITDALASFFGYMPPERIKFKLAVIVYRALHGSAPCYLSGMLRRVADIPSRGRLRSSSTSQLTVRPSRRATVRKR